MVAQFRGEYGGFRFEIRRSSEAWIWLLSRSRDGGAAIGVASSEAEAADEACRAIENLGGDTITPGAIRWIIEWSSALRRFATYAVAAKQV
jgi:hypothetical protein